MQATNSNAQNQKVRLLCVDDDPKFLGLFTAILEAARYNVVATSDPYHALEIATGGNFDLIILDHDMPGMNGAELAVRIKQQKRDLPIILFSGNFSLPQAPRDVVDEYVAKGESVELLLQRVSARVSPLAPLDGQQAKIESAQSSLAANHNRAGGVKSKHIAMKFFELMHGGWNVEPLKRICSEQ